MTQCVMCGWRQQAELAMPAGGGGKDAPGRYHI